MAKQKRRQFFVDRKVQGALILRSIAYWMFCLLAVLMMVVSWQILTSPPQLFTMHLDEMWTKFAPALLASLLLLPIVIVDMVRFSNRFAGPIFRLRRCLHQAAQGENVQPIHFRENDYWREAAEDFNAVLKRLEAANRLAESRQSTSASDEKTRELTGSGAH